MALLQIIVDTFKFGMPIDHSKSKHRDDKLSVKWAWSGHVNQSYLWKG